MIVLSGPGPSAHFVARELAAHQAIVIVTAGVPRDAEHLAHELQALLAERRPKRGPA